jgi:hypothetical protein
VTESRSPSTARRSIVVLQSACAMLAPGSDLVIARRRCLAATQPHEPRIERWSGPAPLAREQRGASVVLDDDDD